MGRDAAYEVSMGGDRLDAVQLETGSGKGMTQEVYASVNKAWKGLVGAIEGLKTSTDPVQSGENYATLARSLIGKADAKTQAAIAKEGLHGGTAVSFIAGITGVGVEEITANMAVSAAAGGGAAFEGERDRTLRRGSRFVAGMEGDTTAVGWSNKEEVINKAHGIMLGKLTRGPGTISMNAASKKLTKAWGRDDGFVDDGMEELYTESMDAAKEQVDASPISGFSRDLAERIRDSGLGGRISAAGTNVKKRAAVDREYQKIRQDVWSEDPLGNALRGITGKGGSLFRRTNREGGALEAGDYGVAAAVGGAMGFLRGGGVEGAIESAKKAVLSIGTIPAAELLDDTKRHDSDVKTGKPKRRGGNPMQRAAGFGERESAMDTINKSLRHTERMLKQTGVEISALKAKKEA